MKRFTVYLSVLLSLFLLSASALAKTPNRLVITNAIVDLGNDKIDIYGLNFGDDPEVWLSNNESPLVLQSSTDTLITASLLGDIQPGTYRLMVVSQGFDFSHPEKADSLDVTIGADGICDCPITREQLDELYDRIEYLEFVTFRFADMGDGTIRDNKSGLIWLKNANCFSSINWSNAMDAAASLAAGQCGLADGSAAGDWRLPTSEEWMAFMSTVYNNPALVNRLGDAQWSKGDAFTGVQSYYYWSSTESGLNAMTADMSSGNSSTSPKTLDSAVWPVRSDN